MYVVQVDAKTFKVKGNDQSVTNITLHPNVSMTTLKSVISDTIVINDSSRNCFDYNNDPTMGIEYGKLYTELSALNIPYPHYTQYPVILQGICPNGWHVPNDSDFLQLEYTAGMSPGTAGIMFKFRGTISDRLKVTGPEWWFSEGTDDFGFSAKGSGVYECTSQGCEFYWLTSSCYFWTYSNEFQCSMMRLFSTMDLGIWRGYYTFDNGALSVRCVKN